MTTDEHRRALSFAVKRIVATLESWDEPWRDDRQRIPEFLEWKLLRHSFAEWPDPHPGFDMALDIKTRQRMAGEEPVAIEQGTTESLGRTLARTAVKALGMDVAEGSKTFADLSVEMERLQLGLLRVMEARSGGDPVAEEKAARRCLVGTRLLIKHATMG